MKNLLLFYFVLLSFALHAQIPDGQTAPDFNLDDLDGVSHELYDYLDQGYSVALDFSATWCGPCWNYHQQGVLEDLWAEHGPDGSDKVMVFMIEADANTSLECIYGPTNCTGGSIGDWTAGVDYPILNPEAADAAAVNADFQINYYPTLYGVAPNGEIYEIGQESLSEWETWLVHSYQMHNTTWEVNDSDCETSSIDLVTQGGEGQIQFEWSNGATSEDLFDVEPGEYFVTMTDDNDYEVVKGPIEVENNNGVDIELQDLGNVSCEGESNGYIMIEADGGSGDFEYEWSNGSTEQNLMDVPAGDYDLIVYDTDTGCEFEMSYEIEEPDELEYEYELTQPDCDGDALGVIEFEIDGGTWPMQFIFPDFETFDDEVTLEPGEYDVIILDANGCEAYVPQFTIEESDAPIAMSEASGIFTCAQDSVTVDAANSSAGPNITYSWYDPSYTLISHEPLTNVDSAGMYTLEVMDMNSNCISVSTVMVGSDFTTPTAVASVGNNIDCSNSIANLTAAGSTADSTVVYAWTTLGGNIISDTSAVEIQADQPGMYYLTVSNIYSGCQTMASVEVVASDVPEFELEGEEEFCEDSYTTLCVTLDADEAATWMIGSDVIGTQACVEVTQTSNVEVIVMNTITGCESTDDVEVNALALPEINLDGNPEICEGDIVLFCVDNNSDHDITWRVDGNDSGSETCIEVSTSSNIEVYVTNSQTSCESFETFTTTITDLPSVDIAVPSVLDCNNQSATLDLTTEAGNTVTWLDENFVTIADTEDIMVTQGGEYLALVTNANGCQALQTVLVEQNLDDLPLASYAYQAQEFTFQFTDSSQGNIVSRTWDFGDGNTSDEMNPTHTYATPGYYDVSLAVINDCGENISTQQVLAIAPLQITSVTEDISCFGENDGRISINVFGGLEPYDFDWGSNNVGLFGPNQEELAPGDYTIIVSDAAGNMQTANLTITEPSALDVQAQISGSAVGSTDGSITLDISGGSGEYSVLWDNGSTELTLTDLAQGEYTVAITDERGCTVEQTYAVMGTTSVDELEFIDALTIAPNPVSDILSISIDLNSNENLQLSLMNIVGKSQMNIITQGKTIREQMDVSHLASGIYLLEIRSNNKVSLRKVMIN